MRSQLDVFDALKKKVIARQFSQSLAFSFGWNESPHVIKKLRQTKMY